MTRSELISKLLTLHHNLTSKQVEKIVDLVFDGISNALAEQKRVELRGFGSFFVKERKSKQSRNPRTGKVILIEDKTIPFFRTGKELRARLNLPQAS